MVYASSGWICERAKIVLTTKGTKRHELLELGGADCNIQNFYRLFPSFSPTDSSCLLHTGAFNVEGKHQSQPTVALLEPCHPIRLSNNPIKIFVSFRVVLG